MIAAAGYLGKPGRILEKQAAPASADDSTVLLADDGSTQVNTYADNAYQDIASLDSDGSEESSTAEKSEIGEAVLASTSGSTSVLAAAKLNREQVRAKSREELLEVMNSTSVEQEQKQCCFCRGKNGRDGRAGGRSGTFAGGKRICRMCCQHCGRKSGCRHKCRIFG